MLTEFTPFRQMMRAYSALLGIHETMRLMRAADVSMYAEIADLKRRIAALEGTMQERVSALESSMGGRMAALEGSIDERVGKSIRDHLLFPLPSKSADRPFMPFSTCSASDFLHPRYDEIRQIIKHHRTFHRKVWEWVFIYHHLELAGALSEGKRGLAFGVGREMLPSVFAARGASIVATDAPPDIGVSSGWTKTGQHSDSLNELYRPDLVSREVFDAKVSHRFEDMTAISSDLTGFDFVWSACCFEHLGSLEAGMQFVIDSVEKCLKPGGVAVHTTEFNLSSDEETIADGHTVLYRRRDIEELVERLEKLGHEVLPFTVAPDSHYLDGYVDLPPYSHDLSMKIRLEEFVTTSVGIVVRRGR